MKVVLIILAALAVLALVWGVVLPQIGMGAQWAAWRAYKKRHEGDVPPAGQGSDGKDGRP